MILRRLQEKWKVGKGLKAKGFTKDLRLRVDVPHPTPPPRVRKAPVIGFL